jgi:hypothetical protein
MTINSSVKPHAYAAIAVMAFLCSSMPAPAQDLPSYMAPISGQTQSSPADVAIKNVLTLNSMMFDLYGDAAQVFQKNFLSKHPVILGLFSGAGGRFILYRPGMAPLEAPQVPMTYQMLKSVGHSTMAVSEVAAPYVDNPANQSWRAPMLAYRSRMQSALDGLDQTPIPPEWRDNNRTILQNNIAFMDDCAAKGVIAFAALEKFGKQQAPFLARNIAWGAQTQVNHWMGVIGEWKSMLGNDWEKTYAASNTIYVARQNNILFSVLAQYFGSDAINSRLMLIETISFTTTPADMLDALTRIVADRSVGALFFGNYYLMDYELMGGDARAAIIAAAEKRGMKPLLPPAVPFGSHQWPTLITPGGGPTSLSDLK